MASTSTLYETIACLNNAGVRVIVSATEGVLLNEALPSFQEALGLTFSLLDKAVHLTSTGHTSNDCIYRDEVSKSSCYSTTTRNGVERDNRAVQAQMDSAFRNGINVFQSYGRDVQDSQDSGAFLHPLPLISTASAPEFNESRCGADLLTGTYVTSSMVVFNIALSHHRYFLHHQKADRAGQYSNLSYLEHARSFYNNALGLLQEVAAPFSAEGTSIRAMVDILTMAIHNNLAHIASALQEFGSCAYQTALLLHYAATVRPHYYQDSQIREELEGCKRTFINNASFCLTGPESVASAA